MSDRRKALEEKVKQTDQSIRDEIPVEEVS